VVGERRRSVSDRCGWRGCKEPAEVWIAHPCCVSQQVGLCEDHLEKFLETRGVDRHATIQKLFGKSDKED
jgi:hypothetical protein